MNSNQLSVRIVGKVHGRTSALAFVTDPYGNEVSVMWQHYAHNGVPRGYKCQEHGFGSQHKCLHTKTAADAFHAQRQVEAWWAGHTSHLTPGPPPKSDPNAMTGGEGCPMCGQQMDSPTDRSG